jgi:gliding motility-associated-like protein
MKECLAGLLLLFFVIQLWTKGSILNTFCIEKKLRSHAPLISIIIRRFFFTLFFLITVVNFSIAQTCTGAVGAPIVDINFGSGASNPGPALSSSTTANITYTTSTCPNDGFYSIVDTNSNCDSWWYPVYDHTGNPNGYYMLVNADFSPSDFFVDTVANLCGGVTYQFASYIENMSNNSGYILPNIIFTIEETNGTIINSYTTGNIAESNSWNQYGFSFTLPASISTVVLRMHNNAPGGNGNDFGLDDITFSPVGPTISASINGQTSDTMSSCQNNSSNVILNGSVGACYASPVYQWQVSTDMGSTWANIPGATNTTYTRTPTAAGTYLYQLLVANAGNINSSSCRLASNPLTIVVYPTSTLITNSPAAACSPSTINLTAPAVTAGSSTGLTYTYYSNAAATTPVATPTTVSTGGTYYIVGTNSLGCSDTASVVVTITTPPAATISYAGPFCSNDAVSKAVTRTGTAGGTYSSTAGLTINAATGAITPSTSTPGTYTVTYTMIAGTGCTNQTATTSVTITTLPTATISYAGPFCSNDAVPKAVTRIGTAGGTYSSTAGLTINAATGAITPSTSTAGTYTVTYTMAATGGCTVQTATTSVTITALPAATISYAGSPFCKSLGVPQAVTRTGTAGGIYSSTAGLTINAATGAITPSTSTTGTYTVTYTIAAAGGCAVVTATTSVTITTLPAATISYGGSPYCISLTTPQAITQTGTVGGTYSSTAGLTINAATGAITPSSSIAGTYTVTYTMAATGGCAVQTATTSVTVSPLLAPVITCSGSTTTTAGFDWAPGVAGATSYNLSYTVNAGAPVTPAPQAATNYTASGGVGAGDAVVITVTPTGIGCFTSQTHSCTANNCPVLSATISYAGPFCSNDAVPKAVTQTGTAGGTYSSTAGLTINGVTGAITPSTSTAGTYTVTYTMIAGTGCTNQTATTSVTITTLPTATISYAGPFCSNDAVPKAVTRTGTAGGTYSSTAGLTINAATGAIIPSTSSAGTYTVTYTMAATGGCTVQTATTSVTITALPTATIIYAGSPFCKSLVAPQAVTQTGTAGGIYSSTAGLTINAATGAITPSSSTAGTYTVTYTMAAAGGCTVQTATTSVTITTLPAATISYAGSPYCISLATLQAVTQTGTAGGTYSSTAGLMINSATGAITPSTSTAGTYTVSYTMAAIGGCAVQIATTTVTITALPTATISYGSPFCSTDPAAEPVTRTGTAGGTYSSTAGLTINAGTGAITPSTSTVGIYTVTYTMAATGGCAVQTATTSVTISSIQSATISYAGPFCSNDATAEPVTRIGTAGGSYTSTAGLTINGATGAVTPSTSTVGVYTVTYTMAATGGCAVQTATTSITITALPTATVSYGSPFCSTDPAAEPVTQTGTAGGTYSSTAGLTINAITGAITPSTSTPGTYTVTYTMAAAGGCAVQTATASITISTIQSATISYAGPFCSNDATAEPVTQTGTADGTYSSTAGLTINGATGAITPSTSTPGTYTVTYTMAAAGGCAVQTATTSVTITTLPAATITYAGSPFCSSDPAAEPVTQTGTAGGTYSSTAGLTINVSTGAIIPSSSTPGTYTVTYTMAATGGCAVQTATTSVTITTLPAATISYAGPFCSNNPATEPVTQTGTAGGTYSSTAGLTINAATGGITPSGSTPGTYTVTYTIAATAGCAVQTATTSVAITALPVATINYAGSPFCSNDGSAEPVTQTGTAGGTYSSTAGLTIDPVTGAITPSTSIAGTYTVTYTMAATGGCTVQTATTSVTINTLPVATISYGGPFCTSDLAVEPVTHTGTPNGTYSSTPGLTINPLTGAITPSTSTGATYTVTYTMLVVGGCGVQTATTSVTINTTPGAPVPGANPPVCELTPIQTITAVANPPAGSPAGTFVQWWDSPTGGDQVPNNAPDFGEVGTKNYYAESDPPSGCNSISRTLVTLTIVAPPLVTVADTSITIDLDYGTQLIGDVQPLNGSSYYWNTTGPISNIDTLYPYVNPTVTTLYTLIATSNALAGCSDSATVDVIVLDPIAIPNIFSPNGDGVHDTWYIKNLEQYPNAEVDIFNRYGQFLFQAQGNYLENPWDGTYNGSLVPVGAYYYIIKLNSGTAKDAKPIAGCVSIIY